MFNWLLDIFSPSPKYRCHSCGKVMRWSSDFEVRITGDGPMAGQKYNFCNKHDVSEIADFLVNIKKDLVASHD